MISGKLNKPIVIEHTSATTDNILGEELGMRKENYPTRADVLWGSGKKDTSGLELTFPYDITFIVWYYFYEKITEGDIVVYLGKKYQIQSLEPMPETKMLYIRAMTL